RGISKYFVQAAVQRAKWNWMRKNHLKPPPDRLWRRSIDASRFLFDTYWQLRNQKHGKSFCQSLRTLFGTPGWQRCGHASGFGHASRFLFNTYWQLRNQKHWESFCQSLRTLFGTPGWQRCGCKFNFGPVTALESGRLCIGTHRWLSQCSEG